MMHKPFIRTGHWLGRSIPSLRIPKAFGKERGERGQRDEFYSTGEPAQKHAGIRQTRGACVLKPAS